jgi:acyl-CoA synthetase (NDP forming)
MHDIQVGAIFSPQAVAVLGPCHEEGSLAAQFVDRLRRGAYQGAVTAVNCQGSLPEELSLAGAELAVVCLPAPQIPHALGRLAGAGVRAVIVPGSFGERGAEGYVLEQQLRECAEQHNIAVLGPQSVGVVSWPSGLNASLLEQIPEAGGVAFFSPSAALVRAVVDWAAHEGIGLSHVACLGARGAVDEASILQYLAEDPHTHVIAGYLEGVFAARRFARVSQTVTRSKPVVMLLGGLTSQGQLAAASIWRGSETAYRTALRQAGIVVASDLEMFWATVHAFATLPLPQGPHVAVITNSSAAGILTADALSATRLELARLSRASMDALRSHVDSGWVANPVDLGLEASAEVFGQAVAVALADPRVAMALVVVTRHEGRDLLSLAAALARVPRHGKPLALCFVGERPQGVGQIQRAGTAWFASPQMAAKALDALLAYAGWREEPFPVEVCYRRDKTKADLWVRQSLAAGLRDLAGPAVFPLLDAYELRRPNTELARTSKTAARIVRRLGVPVALKIASPHIGHRSDVDGVELGLVGPDAVRQGFLRLTHRVQRVRPEAFLSGCWVQEMVPGPAVEVGIRVVRDPLFGPLVGLAGGMRLPQLPIFRLAPLSLGDASRMVRELIPHVGSHGRYSVSVRALEDVLLTVSQMVLDMCDIYLLELEPVLVSARGAWVVDARVCLVPQS